MFEIIERERGQMLEYKIKFTYKMKVSPNSTFLYFTTFSLPNTIAALGYFSMFDPLWANKRYEVMVG